MADISTIKTTDRNIEIVHPADDTKKLGIMVSLMAISDPRMKRIKRKISDEKLRREAKGKHFKSDDIEENANELLFGAITGWNWYNPTGNVGDEGYKAADDATFKGKKPEFNRASVMAVLTEPGMEWFGDQLMDAISEEKSFFANSEAN